MKLVKRLFDLIVPVPKQQPAYPYGFEGMIVTIIETLILYAGLVAVLGTGIVLIMLFDQAFLHGSVALWLQTARRQPIHAERDVILARCVLLLLASMVAYGAIWRYRYRRYLEYLEQQKRDAALDKFIQQLNEMEI